MAGQCPELKAWTERFALGLDEPTPYSEKTPTPSGVALPDRLAAYETQLIREAAEKHAGNTAGAAASLGIPHRTLNDEKLDVMTVVCGVARP
jgi:two-component system C4-dicarboxylate transport response regulator DctD